MPSPPKSVISVSLNVEARYTLSIWASKSICEPMLMAVLPSASTSAGSAASGTSMYMTALPRASLSPSTMPAYAELRTIPKKVLLMSVRPSAMAKSASLFDRRTLSSTSVHIAAEPSTVTTVWPVALVESTMWLTNSAAADRYLPVAISMTGVRPISMSLPPASSMRRPRFVCRRNSTVCATSPWSACRRVSRDL